MKSPEPIMDLFTDAERDAWGKIADATCAMFALPPVHSLEHAETARDIHNIQCRLLARVAYDKEGRA
jgi:hypothetical protein